MYALVLLVYFVYNKIVINIVNPMEINYWEKYKRYIDTVFKKLH